MRENMSPPGNRYLTAVKTPDSHRRLFLPSAGPFRDSRSTASRKPGRAIAAQRGVNIFQRMNQVNDLPAGQGAPGRHAEMSAAR